MSLDVNVIEELRGMVRRIRKRAEQIEEVETMAVGADASFLSESLEDLADTMTEAIDDMESVASHLSVQY